MFLPILDLTELVATLSWSVLSPQKEIWLEQLAPHLVHPDVACGNNHHLFSFVLLSMGVKSVPKNGKTKVYRPEVHRASALSMWIGEGREAFTYPDC